MGGVIIFTLVLLGLAAIAFIVSIAMSSCNNSGCACAGSAATSASTSVAGASAPADADEEEEAATSAAEAEGNEESVGVSAVPDEVDAGSVRERAIAPVEEEDAANVSAVGDREARLEDAMRRTRGSAHRHVSGAALAGEGAEDGSEVEVTDRVLSLHREVARTGSAEAEAELDALLDAQVAGASGAGSSSEEGEGGASTTQRTRNGGMRANLPMTDHDEELAKRAVEKSVPATFYETEENRDARLKRARRMQALAEQDPDRSLEILQAVGTSGVKHPTRDTLREARHKIHAAQMNGVEHEDVPVESSGRRRRPLDRVAFSGMPLPSNADMMME